MIRLMRPVARPALCAHIRVGGMGASSSSSIYLASPEGDTGKSTVALGVLHLLAASGGRVGVFRPISRTKSDRRDYILELLIEHDSTDLSYEDCIGSPTSRSMPTRKQRSGRSSPDSMRWRSDAIPYW